MRKRTLAGILCLILILAGCGPAGEAGAQAPKAKAAEQLGEKIPAGPVLTVEEAARLYTAFLDSEICGLSGTYKFWVARKYIGRDPKDMFHVLDVTGDGIPELFINGPGSHEIWSIQEGEIVSVGMTGTHTKLLSNGGLYSHGVGAAAIHYDYRYTWLSPESEVMPEIDFRVYPEGFEEDDPTPRYYIGEDKVSAEEYERVTEPYFALFETYGIDYLNPEGVMTFAQWTDFIGVNYRNPAIYGDQISGNTYPYFIYLSDRWQDSTVLFSPLDYYFNIIRRNESFIGNAEARFYEYWWQEMECQYEALLEVIPAEYKAQLIAEQEGWLAYYENNIFAQMAGDIAYGYVREWFIKRMDIVRNRTIELMQNRYLLGKPVGFYTEPEDYISVVGERME